MKGIRLLDIAKQAGVSQATVTRVIRNNGYVSREKRELVEAALRASGYDLAQLKGSISESEKPRVLIIAPRVHTNILFSLIAEEMTCALQAQGWDPDLFFSQDISTDELVSLIERKRRNNLIGIVFCCISMDYMAIRRYLTSLPVPLVMVERTPDIYGLNKVMLHSKEMVFQAVRYLSHLGHRRILCLGVDDQQEVESQRKSGFLEGVRAMGLENESVFCPLEHYYAEDGYEQLRLYAEKHPLPTAIIAADLVMVGVSNYLYEHGYHVPKDVSLVGIDNTYAPYATPRLTSVDFPVTEIVQNTVRILQEAQVEGALPQNILLSSKLIERDSTAAPRKE